MECWNEVRTAYTVARLGTVSAAALELGLHRATVIRHIDALEEQLGTRLFQRHSRGYTPTESGEDLFITAKSTDEKLRQFASRVRDRKTVVSGEIIVTSLGIAIPIVTNALVQLRELHPDTTVRYIESGRLLNLAYGEAHIAIRSGQKPSNPDDVVRPFFDLYSTLYAHTSYIEKYGFPQSIEDFANHRFLSNEQSSHIPFFQWLESNVDESNIILRSRSQRVLVESLLLGFGIGFMPIYQAHRDPNLKQIIRPKSDWFIPLWLVTHIDIHRTAKVQAISKALCNVVEEFPKYILSPHSS